MLSFWKELVTGDLIEAKYWICTSLWWSNNNLQWSL